MVRNSFKKLEKKNFVEEWKVNSLNLIWIIRRFFGYINSEKNITDSHFILVKHELFAGIHYVIYKKFDDQKFVKKLYFTFERERESVISMEN